MITHFSISNFKAMQDFSIDFPKFSCLIGLNDSGKSTLLQALDMMKHILNGNVKDWFNLREWKSRDIRTKNEGKYKALIAFTIEVAETKDTRLGWTGEYNINKGYCTSEAIYRKFPDGTQETLMTSRDQKVVFNDPGTKTEMDTSVLKYEGSVLSILSEKHKAYVETIKEKICGIHSFDMLSPQSLRKSTRASDNIGYGGEGLSAFISSMKPEQRGTLFSELQKFYPQIEDFDTTTMRSGWKKLSFTERFGENLIPAIEARHISDGILRIIAITAQTVGTDKHDDTLMFDEIENGINPSVMESLMDYLTAATPQIIITTHNPVVLNFLDDDTARASVILLYRNKAGYIKAKEFFSLPSAEERLKFMGPGEAYLDGDIENYVREARALDEQ